MYSLPHQLSLVLSVLEKEGLKPEIQNVEFFYEYGFIDNHNIIIER